MATPTTLYEYYTSIGQSLPSVAERKLKYEQAGLGSAASYIGSADQNNKLLAKLVGGSSVASGNTGGTYTKTPTPTASKDYDALKKNIMTALGTGKNTYDGIMSAAGSQWTPQEVNDYIAQLGLGRLPSPKGQGGWQPGDRAPVITPVTPVTPVTPTTTGDSVLDATLASIRAYLDKLSATGKTINPYVDITPEKMAEFLKRAENEIDPYYATQLKLARESILTDLDYSKDEIGKFEQDLEKTYGKSLRTLGEGAAEQGFAMSGQRNLNEQDLAYQTQRQIEDQRNQLTYNAGKAARTFAQEWGKPAFETPTIGVAPTVRAGERSFAKSGTEAPIYQLSNDIYDQLQGSKQYEQKAAILARQAQQEESEYRKRYLELT